MEQIAGQPADSATHPAIDDRLDGAPISWSACEVPGWGACQGLFLPLGRGDAGIASVLDALAQHGYDGWLALGKDTAITGDEPPVGREPMIDVRDSIALHHNTALRTQEVNS